MADVIPIGEITDMDFITVDNNELASAMSDLIMAGSQMHQIAYTDLNLPCKTKGLQAFDDVAHALKEGTKFFDAILYFCIPEDQRPTPDDTASIASEEDRKWPNIARNLFYISIYLLTRGSIPISDSIDSGSVIPAFLKNIFVMKISPNDLCKSLGDVDIRKLDHAWIKAINWSGLNIIARNRLALGVAGYRLFAPFKMYPAEATVQGGISMSLTARNAAYETAKTIATRPYDWTIHPITRNPNVITMFGPLNPNLQNLMVVCYSQNTLTQMQTLGMIVNIPVYNNRYTNFMKWDPKMVAWQPEPIFQG